ncbi:MAG TPA: hypothetical protein VFS00_16680, partial [Polyangiaceae bacterium]|nr:hypothetical protein [Polyangiaceae bacterium]
MNAATGGPGVTTKGSGATGTAGATEGSGAAGAMKGSGATGATEGSGAAGAMKGSGAAGATEGSGAAGTMKGSGAAGAMKGSGATRGSGVAGGRGSWGRAGLLGAAYVGLLVATAGALGYARDEGFYAAAAEVYAGWFDLLVRAPLRALGRPALDATFGVNHEHPPLCKLLFTLSWR